MNRRLPLLVAALALSVLACDRQKSAEPAPPAEPVIAGLPATLAVKQRSTAAVPGSEGKLLLTIGDITRGQVPATLDDTSGVVVMPTRRMYAGDQAEFRYGDRGYRITLERLENSLIGDDIAKFVITAADAPAAVFGEAAKVEKLLAAVAGANGAKFIRKGTEYEAAEAADHLRTKWQAAGRDRITAEQFIEEIGTESSTSGEPYQIRFSDGRSVPAAAFLRERLAEIEREAR